MNGVDFIYAGHYCSNRQVQNHAHKGAELVLVTAGECVTVFEGRELYASPGVVYITPPGVWHKQKNITEFCETYYVVIAAEHHLPEFSLRSVDTGLDPLLLQWFKNLVELYKSGDDASANLLLMAILERLKRFDAGGRQRGKYPPALLNAVNYLEQHYAGKIVISDLAKKVSVSQSHLNMLFRKFTGCGPVRYLLGVRMHFAQRMLRDMSYRIADISIAAGFSDVNYFSRAFRAFYGISPGEYRKKIFSDPKSRLDFFKVSN